jgi:hypothetical protein
MFCRPCTHKCKTVWSANEETVVVKLAVPYTIDFVLVDKTRMNEINIGNKHVVTVTPLFFSNLVSRPILMSSVTITGDVPYAGCTLPY